MAGFYRSRYVRDGKEKYAAVTQFEESDARRAFPCFDHPAMKATFEVEMIIDGDLTAISNTDIAEEKPMEDGRKLVRSNEPPGCPPTSCSLGSVIRIHTRSRGVLIRVAAVPGKAQQGKYSLEFLRKALTFCEEYYGIQYPLSKLDLIAIADFAFGAMENWGPSPSGKTSCSMSRTDLQAGEERMCVVIAMNWPTSGSENLVTPRTGSIFAQRELCDYFGYRVVDHYYPEWDVWEQFCRGRPRSPWTEMRSTKPFPSKSPVGITW